MMPTLNQTGRIRNLDKAARSVFEPLRNLGPMTRLLLSSAGPPRSFLCCPPLHTPESALESARSFVAPPADGRIFRPPETPCPPPLETFRARLKVLVSLATGRPQGDLWLPTNWYYRSITTRTVPLD